MTAIGRRVHRLEERISPAHETAQEKQTNEWVERIRRKRGMKPPTEADFAKYRGLSIADILRMGRSQPHPTQEVIQTNV